MPLLFHYFPCNNFFFLVFKYFLLTNVSVSCFPSCLQTLHLNIWILDKLLFPPPCCLIVQFPGDVLAVWAGRRWKHSSDRSGGHLLGNLPDLALWVEGKEKQVLSLLPVDRGQDPIFFYRVLYFLIIARQVFYLLWYWGILVDCVVDFVLWAGAALDRGAGGVAGDSDCCVIPPQSSAPWTSLTWIHIKWCWVSATMALWTIFVIIFEYLYSWD